MERTSSSIDVSDIFIVVFVAIIFVTGAVVVFKFMRNKK
jgi:hypothetical protein